MPARETTGGNRDIEAGRRGGLEQQLRRAIAAGDVVKDGRLFPSGN